MTKMIPELMTSDIKLAGVEYSNVVGSEAKCSVSDVSKERNIFSPPFRAQLGPLDPPDDSSTVL